MDERKRVIIKEILFWKENRMLPEQYCDYLLALYSEGAGAQNHPASVNKHKWKKNWWQILFLLMIPISLFVIYFTELSFFLQTAILTSFVVILLFVCIYFTKKGLFLPILHVVEGIILLIFSIKMNDYVFQGNSFTLYILILINCFLWWYTGFKLKLIYFKISSILGVITLFIFIFI